LLHSGLPQPRIGGWSSANVEVLVLSSVELEATDTIDEEEEEVVILLLLLLVVLLLPVLRLLVGMALAWLPASSESELSSESSLSRSTIDIWRVTWLAALPLDVARARLPNLAGDEDVELEVEVVVDVAVDEGFDDGCAIGSSEVAAAAESSSSTASSIAVRSNTLSGSCSSTSSDHILTYDSNPHVTNSLPSIEISYSFLDSNQYAGTRSTNRTTSRTKYTMSSLWPPIPPKHTKHDDCFSVFVMSQTLTVRSLLHENNNE